MQSLALNKQGDKLLYQDIKDTKTTGVSIIKGVGRGSMFTDKKGENIFLASKGQLKKIEIKITHRNSS